MSDCIDTNDQLTQNQLALSSSALVDGSGRYTLAQVDAAAKELADSIVKDAETNPLIVAVNKYGDDVYKSTDYLNGLLRQLIGDTTNYPDLAGRWERGSISNLEMADFLQAYNYTPQGFLLEDNYQKLARNLDSYYKNTFSKSILGGFCDSFANVFVSIDAFFDLIGTVGNIIGEISSLISKIRTYQGIQDLTAAGLIKKLIDEVIEKISDVIDRIFTEVQDKIDNFDPSKITAGFETFLDKSVTKGIMTTREQMCAFFTDANKKSLKDKVVNLIKYAVSLFESPGLEEIQFLMARICAFSANIEALMNDIKKPLDDYSNRYSTIVSRLTNISRINTSTAVRAGAIRYSPSTRREVINRLQGRWTEEGGNQITNTGGPINNVKPITADDYKNLPKCGKVFNGTSGVFGVDNSAEVFDEEEGVGIYGYTRIDLDVKVYLMRLQEQVGTKLIITNGWISKAYNKKIKGDVMNSHLSGLVVDIRKSDLSDPEDFMQRALRTGFKFVKEYDKFIHLDIRAII
jgi:hypothetical protein